MKWHEFKKLIAVIFALSIVAAACGGSDASAGEDAAETETEETTTTVAAGAEAEGDVDTSVEEVEGATYGGTVTIGLEAEAPGLRPWEDSCSTPCYGMMSTIYDRLMDQNENGEYVGFLAETITPNEDLTVWTMTLRPGVVFHNGVELTAQTIADMFPIQAEGTAGSSTIAQSGLASVEATGDLEVTYTLSRPNSAFPASLSLTGLGFVFEPAAAAADSEAFSLAPVGTGPFVIESRDVDNETVVVRNENYWGKAPNGDQLPYLDSVILRPTPDEGTRLDSLVSGTTNAMATLRQGTIRDARAVGDSITLYEHQGNDTGGGMFNVAVPPYDDVRVRRGLTLMNNQEQVIESLGGTGISLPSTQFFSADSPWWSQKVADAWPTFDFPAGQALVQEYVDDPARSDGKAPGEPIDVELSCPPDPTLIAAMQVLEQAWTGSGLVNVNLTNFDQATHINNAVGQENGLLGVHGAHCWRWGSEADPSIPISSFVGPWSPEIATAAGLDPAASVSAGNVANWWNQEAYDASVAAIGTTDFEERYALYESIMMAIATEVPIWYSGGTATAIAVEPSIQGFNSWHLPDGTLGIGHPGSSIRWHEVFMATEG